MPTNKNDSVSRGVGRTNSWENLELAMGGTPCATEEPLPLKLLWMFAGIFPQYPLRSTSVEVRKAILLSLIPLFMLIIVCRSLFDTLRNLYETIGFLTNDAKARQEGIVNAAKYNAPNGTLVHAVQEEAKKRSIFYTFLCLFLIYFLSMMISLSMTRLNFFKQVSHQQTATLERNAKLLTCVSLILGGVVTYVAIAYLAPTTPWWYVCTILVFSFWFPSFIYTLKMRSSLVTAKYKEYYVKLSEVAGGTDEREITCSMLDARKVICEICSSCVEKPLTINFLFGTVLVLCLGLSLSHPSSDMHIDYLLPVYLVFVVGMAYLVFSPLWELTSIARNNNTLYRTLCHNRDLPPEKLGCLLHRFHEISPQVLLFNIQITPGIVRSALATGLTPLFFKGITWFFL